MINYSNRGKLFEKIILNSLNQEKNNGIFFKSPTPILPLQINFENKSPVITKAIFKAKSLCDFYGIFNNKFVLIEAKETKQNLFNLKQIRHHQIKQLITINKLGGISLILISFSTRQECFCIDINTFLNLSKDVKSISYERLEKSAKKLNINEKQRIEILSYLKELIL